MTSRRTSSPSAASARSPSEAPVASAGATRPGGPASEAPEATEAARSAGRAPTMAGTPPGGRLTEAMGATTATPQGDGTERSDETEKEGNKCQFEDGILLLLILVCVSWELWARL